MDTVPLARPLAWASAAEGQSQQASHRGTLTIRVVATDGSVHTAMIPGVYYAASARLNAMSPTDLNDAGVSLKLNCGETKNCVVTFLNKGHPKQGQIIWIENLPFLPSPALSSTQRRMSTGTPLASPILGSLPTHEYVHLVFDHASSPALQCLWTRSVGLGERDLRSSARRRCATCAWGHADGSSTPTNHVCRRPSRRTTTCGAWTS